MRTQKLNFLYLYGNEELDHHIWCTSSTYGYYKLVQYHSKTPTHHWVRDQRIFFADGCFTKETIGFRHVVKYRVIFDLISTEIGESDLKGDWKYGFFVSDSVVQVCHLPTIKIWEQSDEFCHPNERA